MFKLVSKENGKQININTDSTFDGKIPAITKDGNVLFLNQSNNQYFLANDFKAVSLLVPTKEQFTKLIDAIKDVRKKEELINDFLKKKCNDSNLFFPSLEDNICGYFEEVLCDKANIIDYFIYDLDFGTKWKPGMITDNGKYCKLHTASDLYDMLIDNLNAK